MLVSPNLARWIKASVVAYFDARKGAYVLFVDGDDRSTDKLTRFLELRTNGPVLREPCKNHYMIDYWVNILIQSYIDANDAYMFERIFGHTQSMFERCIPVYRFGTGADDDQSLVGHLLLRNTRPIHKLNAANFGVVAERTRQQQGSVEGYYQMELSGEVAGNVS